MPKSRSLIAGLPRGVGVRKTANSSGKEYFRVSLGKKFTGRDGNPTTKNFSTLSDAREWIFGDAQKKNITPPPVVELHATARDNAFSMSPPEWAEAAAAIRKCRENDIDLTSVVDAGLKMLRPSGGTKTFSEVAKLCLETAESEKKSASHIQHIKIVSTRFGLEFGKEAISSFTRETVEEWLSEEFDDQNTRRYYARYLHLFFAAACERNWVHENILKHVPRASVPLGDIEFLSTPDLRQLLHQAHEESAGILLLGIAVKAFAGLRTSELLSLYWRDVNLKQIHVRALNAKTRQARPVSVCRSLATFLKRHQGDPDKRVVPWSRRHWHAQLSLLAETAAVKLPHNCLRHSFGTYHYHHHKNEHKTAAEMGNKPDTVIRWYRAPIVQKAHLDAYWKMSLQTVM